MSDIAIDESYKGASKVDQLKAGVAKIIKNPKLSKYYTKAELEKLTEFVADDGNYGNKALSKIGSMAPTSALSYLLYTSIGTASGPVGAVLTPLVVTGATVAKKMAGRNQAKRNAALVDSVKGNPAPAKAPPASGMLTGTMAPQAATAPIINSEQEKRRAAR